MEIGERKVRELTKSQGKVLETYCPGKIALVDIQYLDFLLVLLVIAT